MQKKQAPITPLGMQQDLAVSQFPNNMAYEINNMRIVTTGSDTSLCLTNEKSNKKVIEFVGTIIGLQVIQKVVIAFVTNYGTNPENKDAILDLSDIEEGDIEVIYQGNLNFDIKHPIESLGILENEEIIKVYWVDGLNPPRLIKYNSTYSDDNSQFDFKPLINVGTTAGNELNLEVNIVEKVNATFNGGVIQYAISYYNRNRQQTPIIHQSALYYTSEKGRGLSPDGTQKTSTAFQLKITNPNPYFDAIRVYRIMRTSIDSTPSVEIIRDLTIERNTPISFYDTGVGGTTINPSDLLYLGGNDLVAGTLTHKDNTLFLGNLKMGNTFIETHIKNNIKESAEINYELKDVSKASTPINLLTPYLHDSNLLKSNKEITFFQKGEVYRFGVQFLSNKGSWSEVIYLGDKENSMRVIPDSYGEGIIKRPIAKVKITIPEQLKEKYIAARLVCVYPSIYDRNVLCQGIVCPTVYNIGDRNDNSPYVQSSWFARPSCTNYTQFGYPVMYPHDQQFNDIHRGVPLEWRMVDNSIKAKKPELNIVDTTVGLPDASRFNSEIMASRPMPNLVEREGPRSMEDTIKKFKNNYGVEKRIVTFHSPELEHSFTDDLYNISLEGVKFRVVGYVPVKQTLSDSTINYTNPLYPEYSSIYNKEVEDKPLLRPYYISGKSLVNFPMWVDGLTSNDYKNRPMPNNGNGNKYTLVTYPVYPWHRKGSLSNQGKVEKPEDRKSTLVSKTMSNLRICLAPQYLETAYDMNISNIELWDKDDNYNTIKVLNVKDLWDIDDNIIYKGDINKVLTFIDNPVPIYYQGIYTQNYINIPEGLEYPNVNINTGTDSYKNLKEYSDLGKEFLYNSDPIPIQYRSTNHAVFAFGKVPDRESRVGMKYEILPYFSEESNFPPSVSENTTYTPPPPPNPNPALDYGAYEPLAWLRNDEREKYGGLFQKTFSLDSDSSIFPKTQKTINSNRTPEGYYFVIGELYRERVENRFGGDTESTLVNNKWNICGEPVYFNTDTTYTLYGTQGDTFLGRYDHLKTYSAVPDNVNNIVDIVSFICETRVNVDGRYDRNRGNKNNLAVSPTNFNLFNKVYSQRNSFFNYHYLDSKFTFVSGFPNQVIWSQTKTLGEEIDTWTNISAANVLDLDGDKGELNKLQRLHNEIFAFQDTGISRILFNPRVQINASDGIPIEIANSGKVEGKVYITDKYGCQNKWAMTETPSGIYFIDGFNKTLLSFNGQGIIDVAYTKGMKSWFNEYANTNKWNPFISDIDSYKLLYDRVTSDVYITSADVCLSFNEQLGAFSSFYSYHGVDWLYTIEDKSYQIKDNNIWNLREGSGYGNFFGYKESYSLSVIFNSDFPIDKTFDTIDFNTNGNEAFINTQTTDYPFSFLRVWNDYQAAESLTKDLKKKFRTWRWQIGRNTIGTTKRDRIRDMWAKAFMEGKSDKEVRLYNIAATYYI